MKKRFSEQVHLDDVPELRAEYKKKLASIELQLSGMVQVKVRARFSLLLPPGAGEKPNWTRQTPLLSLL